MGQTTASSIQMQVHDAASRDAGLSGSRIRNEGYVISFSWNATDWRGVQILIHRSKYHHGEAPVSENP